MSSTVVDLLADPPPGTDRLVSAPGRANLIGEYTDVNDGHVLPVALDLRTVVASRPLAGRTLALRSLDVRGPDAAVEVSLDEPGPPPAGWGRYVAAVVDVLRAEGLALQGRAGVLSSQVPVGAGLSSSAALEVAVALTVLAEPLPPAVLARLCQRAENEGVGVQSGIMDQLASVASRPGTALFLDCRSLAVEHVPLPADLGVLVVDSGGRRELSDSGYNDRRSACAEAARDLGVASLRDADPGQLAGARRRMEPVVHRRARHVLTEELRVHDTVRALRAGDRPALRELFAASHASLRDDFEVSTPELDTLVALAGDTPGVVASRLTGAGFGGCTVSLVEADRGPEAGQAVVDRYCQLTGSRPRWWLSGAAGGAAREQVGTR